MSAARLQALAEHLWVRLGGPEAAPESFRQALLHHVAGLLSCLAEDLDEPSAEHGLVTLRVWLATLTKELERLDAGHWGSR